MSGSRREVAVAVMNTNKQEIVNEIRVFVMVVIDEFRYHQPRTLVSIMIYDTDTVNKVQRDTNM
jgi:hypothetical protein